MVCCFFSGQSVIFAQLKALDPSYHKWTPQITLARFSLYMHFRNSLVQHRRVISSKRLMKIKLQKKNLLKPCIGTHLQCPLLYARLCATTSSRRLMASATTRPAYGTYRADVSRGERTHTTTPLLLMFKIHVSTRPAQNLKYFLFWNLPWAHSVIY